MVKEHKHGLMVHNILGSGVMERLMAMGGLLMLIIMYMKANSKTTPPMAKAPTPMTPGKPTMEIG